MVLKLLHSWNSTLQARKKLDMLCCMLILDPLVDFQAVLCHKAHNFLFTEDGFEFFHVDVHMKDNILHLFRFGGTVGKSGPAQATRRRRR